MRLLVDFARALNTNVGMKKRRPLIPKSVQSAVLLSNRQACCVCQKIHVQLHHIDGNSSNNDLSNLAALCLDHHDMASMQIGLTKKLQINDIRKYKMEWEKRCRNDTAALSHERFTFYYCIYKNPQRLLGAYLALNSQERTTAIERITSRLRDDEPRKKADKLFGFNAVPRIDEPTLEALKSVYNGDTSPSYLKGLNLNLDPAQQYSSQDEFLAFHKYDLWCQIIGQTLAEARGATPVEDLYKFRTAKEIDSIAGKLVTFRLTVRGKGIEIPRAWETSPTGTLHTRAKFDKRVFRINMALRTRDIFSDTSALWLRKGRVSGLGILKGALKTKGEYHISIAPLLIGTGGWNLYPEKYSA